MFNVSSNLTFREYIEGSLQCNDSVAFKFEGPTQQKISVAKKTFKIVFGWKKMRN